MDTSTTPDITYEKLARSIDHSLLRPELTTSEVAEGCELAARYEVASVCVKPADVVLAAELLRVGATQTEAILDEFKGRGRDR